MRSCGWLVALLLVLFLVLSLAGCGGGGNGGGGVNTAGGAVNGRIRTANAASYHLVLDGHRLTTTPSDTGSFTIPHVPPGRHTLAVVGGSGMTGSHASFTLVAGRDVTIPDITPTEGGQIAGLVSRVDDGGNLTPLAGVTVLADPNPVWYMGASGSGSSSGGSTGTAAVTPRDADTVELSAVTDDNGSYVIPAVAPGSYAVTVNVPGLEQGVDYAYVSAGQTSACDFRLTTAVEPGVGTVRGTVLGRLPIGAPPPEGVPTTAPLEGATVSVTTEQPWQPRPPIGPVPLAQNALTRPGVPSGAIGIVPPVYIINEFMTLTDHDGNYSLNVPAGHLTLNVWAETYASQSENFTLHDGETLTKDFTLSLLFPVPGPQPASARR